MGRGLGYTSGRSTKMAVAILLIVLNLQKAIGRLLKRLPPPPPPHWRRGLALSSHHYPVFWLLLKDLSLIRNGSTYNRKGNFCSRGAKRRRGKGTDTYRKLRTCQTQWSGEGEGCEGGRGEGLWVLDRQHGGTYGCRSVGRD